LRAELNEFCELREVRTFKTLWRFRKDYSSAFFNHFFNDFASRALPWRHPQRAVEPNRLAVEHPVFYDMARQRGVFGGPS